VSWVTDVLLCANLIEKFDEDLRPQKSSAAIDEINAWLREKGAGTLADLSVHMETGGKAAQALVYGGSFNHLEVKEFKKFVLSRNWQMPESVRLLLNDEEDDGFSVFVPEA
jgi:hypothetical protein